jgi:hypothetical protein
MTANVRAKIHFYDPGLCRRKVPIPGPHFGCVVEIDKQSHDCRIFLEARKPVELGETIVLPIQFLRPELVMPKFSIGKKFFLWELGAHIAEGEIVEFVTRMPKLSVELKRQLANIEPSRDRIIEYFPCAVELIAGANLIASTLFPRSPL